MNRLEPGFNKDGTLKEVSIMTDKIDNNPMSKGKLISRTVYKKPIIKYMIMDEEIAKNILNKIDKNGIICSNDSLYCINPYINWRSNENKITLDDKFDYLQLEAMAWWMKTKKRGGKL